MCEAVELVGILAAITTVVLIVGVGALALADWIDEWRARKRR